MKGEAIVRIIIYSLVILILAAILTGGILAGNILSELDFDAAVADGEIEPVGSVSAETVKSIDIEWVGGTVLLQTADTDEITISENGGLDSKNKLVWKQTGENLKIQFSQPKGFWGNVFGMTSNMYKDLVVTVPKDWICTELEVQSVSAELTVADITVGHLDIETVSGDVKFTGSVREATLNSVSADCELRLDLGVQRIDTESVSGDITVYLTEEQGFSANLDSVSGHIISEFGYSSHGDFSCRIDGESVSGDITIRKIIPQQ